MTRLVRQLSLSAAALLLAHGYALASETAEHGLVDPQAAHDAAVDAAHAGAEAAHGAAEGAHGGGVGLPQFDPSSFASQVFWLAVTFAVLYVFFAKKTLPDIGSVLKKREVHVRSTLEAAKRQKEVAEGLQADYEAGLERARQEAMSIYSEVEKSIKEHTEEQNKSFQKSAAQQTRAVEASIEKAKIGAIEDMQHLAAEIASKAAEKIIGVETDIDHAKTVVRSLKTKAA